MDSTNALDFKYGKKTKDDKQTKFNIYELGGGRTLSNMLSAILNERSIQNSTVCIVVDLSKPANSVDSVLFWLNAVRESSQIALQNL